GARHRSSQWHHAREPLPAFGSRGGRAVRLRAGNPRLARTVDADLNDGAGHGFGAGAARAPWQPAGSRDRVSDGCSDFGRAVYFVLAQPLLATSDLLGARTSADDHGAAPMSARRLMTCVLLLATLAGCQSARSRPPVTSTSTRPQTASEL